MTEMKFELTLTDLTPEKQKEFKDFIGEDWKDGMEKEPIWGMNKVRKTDIPPGMEGVVDQLVDAGVKDIDGIVKKLTEQMASGNEISAMAIDKETGEVTFIDDDGVAGDNAIDMLGATLEQISKRLESDDCQCPKCQARRAGNKAHPTNWN